ncbi:acyltransferase family protein [Lachnospiraceae bacterium OttesenSCG-928-J05]|nr:acyltransferase family protein [Lachnospiraceae bacterium OttesenSCG-928-J05]
MEKTLYIKKRDFNMDLLRVMASLMVVVLHVSGLNWYTASVSTSQWKALNFYDSAVRSCVPLFFMLSGKLLLEKNSIISLHDLLFKKSLRLFTVYIFWSLFYAIDTIGIGSIFSKAGITSLFFTFANAKYHLWFLPVMIGIYLLFPILYSFTRYENGKYLAYACYLFLIFGILQTTLNLGNNFIVIDSFPIINLLGKMRYELIGYSGYFLLGFYLAKRQYNNIKIRHLLLFLMSTIIISSQLGAKYSLHIDEPSSILFGYMTLPVFLETIFIYIIFLKLNTQNIPLKIQILVTNISKNSLLIYVLHPFILQHLDQNFNISTMSFNAIFSVPLISIFIFSICICTGKILYKIPILNKWFI